MKRISLLLTMGVLIFVASVATSFGQATSSVISGLVRDSSQAVIAGANVSVTNLETGVSRTTQSDAQGRYRIGELSPGPYQITVTMTGFSKETQKGIVLAVGQEMALNITLQVGAVEQEVTVTEAAPVVETTTATVSTQVSQEQLRELPLNGRSFTDLITLGAMVNAPTNAIQGAGAFNYANGPQLTIAGARQDFNSFMIDGTDMNPPENGTPGSALGVQLGVDTIREYQVITSNAKAEYGRSSGGIINAVTRSGGNDFHGSLFEFLRNSDLDARRFIDPGALPPFKRNQFGGTVGGPVKRNKSFFFLSYEGLRQRLTTNSVYTVPTQAARQGIGILSAGQTVIPSVVPYINLIPLPNGLALGNGVAQYIGPIYQPGDENFGSARYDHHLSDNDSFFARYTIDKADNIIPGQLLSNTSVVTANQYLTLQEDHIFNPTLLNMFRAGYNRSVDNILPLQVPGGASLGFSPGIPLGSLAVTGAVSPLGPGGITQLFQTQNAFQFEDDVTKTHGAHTIKFGAMVERFQWNSDQPAFAQGSITFSNLQNFLLGGPVGTSATYLLAGSSTYRHLRSTLFSFFAQDDWKVSPRFTLSYGLRWEFTTGVSENDGLLSHLSKSWQTAAFSDLVTGSLYQNRIDQFQPRLGFNWGLDQAQKTVLSGAVGIFQQPILNNYMVSFRAQLPFYSRGTFANINSTQTFPDIRAMIAATAANGVDIGSLAAFRVDRTLDYNNFKEPTFYRSNLTLQRELPGQMAVTIGFVGSLGRHEARRQAVNNWPQPIVEPNGSLFFPPAPAPQFTNPNFSMMELMSSDVNSMYSALTGSLKKRFSRGIIFQANYTYSKCIDDSSATESNYGTSQVNQQWSPDRTLDRARCNFNPPHSFVFNGLYELPFGPGKNMLSNGTAGKLLGGWQVGGIVTIQQGLPFTVTSSAATTGYAFIADRPNVNPGVDINQATQGAFGNRNQYFDTSIFNVPPPGTIGNADRNLLLGPPLVTSNLSINRSFTITERAKLEFRGEFFNAINQTSLGFPAAAIFSSFAINPATGKTQVVPGTGRITTTTSTAREIQFGMKLIF